MRLNSRLASVVYLWEILDPLFVTLSGPSGSPLDESHHGLQRGRAPEPAGCRQPRAKVPQESRNDGPPSDGMRPRVWTWLIWLVGA